MPAFERDPPDGACHRRVRHPANPACCGHRTVEARLGGEVGKHRLRGVGVEFEPLTQCGFRAEIATDDRSVGDCRLLAAPAVAGRTGVCTGRARTDPECAARVHPRDRTAARAHRLHVDHRDLHRVAADRRVGCPFDGPVAHESDIARCPAHIEGHHTGTVRRFEQRPADDTGGRSREHRRDRPLADGRHIRDTAVRLHDPGVGQAAVADPTEERIEIGPDDRCHVGIDDSRRGALVLAELRQCLVGGHHRHVESGAESTGDSLLGLGVCVGVQQRDGDALDRPVLAPGRLAESLEERTQCVLVGFAFDTVGRRALVEFVPVFRGDQRVRLRCGVVVERGPVLSADRQHVPEPLCRDQRRPGAPALEHGVRRNGRAVPELLDSGVVDSRALAGGLDPGEDTLALVRCRRNLRRRHSSTGNEHDIGERAADIDPE
ncbi:MAG: hypothetical protein J07HX64_01502 [halophilic archaeon J07HX64]|nr:MAG: hypothetical protein J07HX64_01502 [halophilic archaeon J07HX64]